MIDQRHIDNYNEIITECKAIAEKHTRQTFLSICTLLSTIAADIYPNLNDTESFTQLINNYLIHTNSKYQELTSVLNRYQSNHINCHHTITFGYVLYKGLRCKIVHNDYISQYFYIAHKFENPNGHLSIQHNKIVLVAEDLLYDIEQMLQLIINDPSLYTNGITTICNRIERINLTEEICVDPIYASGLPMNLEDEEN